MQAFLHALNQHPRRWLSLLAAVCTGMFAFGIYLQLVEGLDPCPMCIVQRYALVGVGLAAALAALFPQKVAHRVGAVAVVGVCLPSLTDQDLLFLLLRFQLPYL
jgi:disulfide bond formation protein DsbB